MHSATRTAWLSLALPIVMLAAHAATAETVIRDRHIYPSDPQVGGDGVIDMPAEATVLEGVVLDRVTVRVNGSGLVIRDCRFIGYRTSGPNHPLFIRGGSNNLFENLVFDGTNRGIVIQSHGSPVTNNEFRRISVRNLEFGHNGCEACLVERGSYPFSGHHVEGLRVRNSLGGGLMLWHSVDASDNTFVDVRLYGAPLIFVGTDVRDNTVEGLEVQDSFILVSEGANGNTISGWHLPPGHSMSGSNLMQPKARGFWMKERDTPAGGLRIDPGNTNDIGPFPEIDSTDDEHLASFD